MNKLIPELSSVREFTDAPSTKGVATLAIFANTKATTAKLTLNLKSLLPFGHKYGSNSLKVLVYFACSII
jgi:hypothetical protein